MAFIIKDRVKEGTTSTGTGAVTLGGAAATFDPFNSYMVDGDTTYYAIVHTATGVDEWEVGIGTWNTGNTLTRTTVLAGSNGTSAENFSEGTKDVFMTYPASKAVYTDASGDIDINGGTIDGTTIGATTADTGKFTTLETTSNADIGGYVDLEVLSDHAAYKEGRIWYDSLHKTLNFYSDDSNVVHELGIEEHQRVYNNTGSTITKGSPLYFSGNYTAGTLDVPTVGLADATDVNAYNAQGLAASDIANNSYGYCIVAGQLTDLDTSGLTAGQNFFVGLTPGAVQNSSPVYPNYPMCLGWVVNSHATEGILLVNQQNHSVNSFRVRTDAHIGDDLIVGGNLQVLGTTTTTSTSDVTAGAPFYRANEGDAIGEAGTTFSGTGLDDAFFAGHFTGTTATTYYVKIDSVGTPDTFAVSTDDFATTISTGNAITGDEQMIHSADNISVTFGATTGHTLNDKWTGTASPILVDSGFFTNRNTGTSGVGYTHMGFYYDVSEDKWVLLDEYDPTPEGAINLSHSSTSFATLKAGLFEGDLQGDVTGDVTGNASTADSLSTSRTIGGVAFNGTANIDLPGVNTTGNQDTSGNAATATALETARTIQLTGDVTGSATFDGTANASITAVVQDDSHSHVISNVDGLQAALDDKVPDARTITAGNGLTGGGDLTANRTIDFDPTYTPTFAGMTTTANITFGDNDKAIFGAGSDLQIYHNGSHSYITDSGTGDLKILGVNVEIGDLGGYKNFKGVSQGASTVYYNNQAKLATTSTGIDVTGTVTADGLTVEGAGASLANFYRSSANANFDAITFKDTTNTNTNAKIGWNANELRLDGTSNIRLVTDAKNRLLVSSGGDLSLYEDTGTTAKFFWDASVEGLGIGDTSFTNKLNVTGAMPSAGTPLVQLSENSGSARDGLYLDYTGTTNSAVYSLKIADATKTHLAVRGDGNVGIGTSSPSDILHISKASTSGKIIIENSDQPRGNFVGYSNSDELVLAADEDNLGTGSKIRFRVDADEKMTLTDTGRLGVGIEAPAYAFHAYHPTTNVVASFESGDGEVWIDLHDSNSGAYGALVGHSNVNLFQIADASVDRKLTLSPAGDLSITGNMTIDQGTAGDAVLTIRADTDNNNEGDHSSIRLKQDGDLVDWRIGLGRNDTDTNGNGSNSLVFTAMAGTNDGLLYSPDAGTTSYKIWHAGNDGAGSGLDADTIDGLGSGSFIRSDADDNVTGNTEWQDNYGARFGNGADFRIWHNGSHTYLRNYNHANGNIYIQGEDLEGTNTNLVSGITNVSQTYVQLWQNNSEKLRTIGNGIRIKSGNGEGDFGPQNTSWFHMTTDRPNFYMNKGLRAAGTIGVYNQNTYLTSDDLYLNGQIIHYGDNNTYMQFHAADQWRVVVGGSERLEVKNSSPHVLVTGTLQATLRNTDVRNAFKSSTYNNTGTYIAGRTLSGNTRIPNANIGGGSLAACDFNGRPYFSGNSVYTLGGSWKAHGCTTSAGNLNTSNGPNDATLFIRYA